MGHPIKKTLEELSEEDLRAVTGGCATCAGLKSIALKQADRALDNVADNPGTDFANKEWVRAGKLRGLARRAQASINQPVLQGCDHCKDATTLARRIGRNIRSR